MTTGEEHQRNIKDCKAICQEIQLHYHVDFKTKSSKVSPYKRVYCGVCKKLGYSDIATILGLGIHDHSTVLYHMRNIKDVKKEMVDSFISYLNTKDIREIKEYEEPKPNDEKKKNIYELTGFRYDGGKKECSVLWKRFYPLRAYRGI